MKKFIIEIFGDWYHGKLEIIAPDLKEATFEFTSMCKCYGEANIIAPEEYKNWVFNKNAGCFMTYEENQDFENERRNSILKFHDRIAFADDETIDI